MTILLPQTGIAVFFFLWALYNKTLGGIPIEAGVYTFPWCVVAYCVWTGHKIVGNCIGIFSCLIILGNYGVPAKYVLYEWNTFTLASKREKTIMWARVMKFNIASAMVLWTVVLGFNVVELMNPRG